MRIAKTTAWIGIIAMTAVLANGFINGNFTVDGGELLKNPWGIVSLVDLYVGFALFSVWIVFREANKLVAFVWVVLMMVLGFFAGSLYALVALYRCEGDWAEFFLGARRNEFMAGSK